MSNASGIFTQSPHDEARAYFATATQMHSGVARLNTSTSKNPSLDVTGEISATIPAHGTKDRFGMPRLVKMGDRLSPSESYRSFNA